MGQVIYQGVQNNFTSEVEKNLTKLENIEKKIVIISEVQIAHKEQDIRGFEDVNKSMKDKYDLILSLLSDISKDVKELRKGQNEIKEDLKKVKVVTGNNCIEIEYLKTIK